MTLAIANGENLIPAIAYTVYGSLKNSHRATGDSYNSAKRMKLLSFPAGRDLGDSVASY